MPQIHLSLVIRNALLPNRDHGSYQGCVGVCPDKGSACPEGTVVQLPPSEATHGGHERDVGARVLNAALLMSRGGSTGPGVSIMSPGSHDKRAAGCAASLSLLRVPRAPPSAVELTAEHAEVAGRDATHRHSVPTGPSCQGGFLPSGTSPREPVLGSPRLVQEGPASKQSVPGHPRPCQGSASCSGPVHPGRCWVPGAPGSVVI